MNSITRENRVKWFENLSGRLGITLDSELNLLTEAAIEQPWLEKLENAVKAYIRASLNNPPDVTSENELLALGVARLANRTPNGVLIPKEEFQGEFNQLHRAVVSWVRSLGIDDLVYQFFTPVVVRLVGGEKVNTQSSRPYSSEKLHTDIWNSEPYDWVNVNIPLLGDTEKTTVEYYHPPDDFEETFLRRLDDYDEGKELEGRCRLYPAFRRGHVYFLDAILPHKTVKGGGGNRVMLTLPLRRVTTDEERIEVESLCDQGRLKHFIDREEWYEYGSTKFMKFNDTYADAEKGIFNERPYDSPLYEVVGSLP